MSTSRKFSAGFGSARRVGSLLPARLADIPSQNSPALKKALLFEEGGFGDIL